jgi:hypothetical protein
VNFKLGEIVNCVHAAFTKFRNKFDVVFFVEFSFEFDNGCYFFAFLAASINASTTVTCGPCGTLLCKFPEHAYLVMLP